MSRQVSPVTDKPYGLARVTRVWGVARATVYRHRRPGPDRPRRRPGPVGPMADADLLEAIRAVLAASPFHGEGHRKVWARLRHAGTRTSKRRVLRLMREHSLLAPGRSGVPRGPRAHNGTIIPETIDTMWGTDLTTAVTGEGQAAVLSLSITARPSALASTRRTTPRASRRSNPSGRACAGTSAASPRVSPAAWLSDMITGPSTWLTTSRTSSTSSASRARRRSSGHPRATAVPNASSVP